jgi:hypothetical protein
MDLTYGNNRLVGDSWWNNVSRTFDGVRAAYQQGRFRMDVFASSVVIIRNGVIDHHLEGNNLYGAYATAKNVIRTPLWTFTNSGTCGPVSRWYRSRPASWMSGPAASAG